MASDKSLTQNTNKRPPTALERIAFLEQRIFGRGPGDNQALFPIVRDHGNQLKSADKILAALIEIVEETVGQQAVSNRIVAIRGREVEAEVVAQEEAFDEAVKNGDLANVAASSKTDLLIAISQTDADGKPRGARKAFAPITGYTPEVGEAFGYDRENGKLTRELQVGEVVEVKDAEGKVKCKVKIEGLYEPVVKAPEEAPAAEAPTGLVDASGAPVSSESAEAAPAAAEGASETAGA